MYFCYISFNLTANLPDSSCKRTGVSFFCQYAFPLCDCKTGDLYLPSQEKCQEVSTVTCKTLWPKLKQEIQPLKLPNCSTLPMATYPPGTYMYTVMWNKCTSVYTCRYQWFW